MIKIYAVNLKNVWVDTVFQNTFGGYDGNKFGNPLVQGISFKRVPLRLDFFKISNDYLPLEAFVLPDCLLHLHLCLNGKCVCSIMSSSLRPHGPHSRPRTSVHGISQARIMEQVVISFSRGSSQPRNQNHVSCIDSRLLTTEPPGKPKHKHKRIKMKWCTHRLQWFWNKSLELSGICKRKYFLMFVLDSNMKGLFWSFLYFRHAGVYYCWKW